MKLKKLHSAILMVILTTVAITATLPVPTTTAQCPTCDPCAQVCMSNDADNYIQNFLPCILTGIGIPASPVYIQMLVTQYMIGNATIYAAASDCCVDVADLRQYLNQTVSMGHILGNETACGWPPAAVISVDPKVTSFYNDDDTGLVCTNFTVDVRVDNVTNMQGYEFKLSFDSLATNTCTLLPDDFGCSLCDSCSCNCCFSNCSLVCTPPCINVTESTFGEPAGKVVPGGVNPIGTMYGPMCTDPGTGNPTWCPLQNVTDGFVWAGGALPFGSPFTGSGVLMTIEFHIECDPPRLAYLTAQNKSIVECLHLYNTSLVTPVPEPIPHRWRDGCYVYTRAQKVIGAPTCSFSFTPPSPVTVCTDVTCTFTGSQGSAPITSYAWIIQSGPATWITADGASTRVFHCDDEGDVVIGLNVTNDDGLSAYCEMSMHQIKPAGARQDLYTSPNRFCNQTTDYVGLGLAVENIDNSYVDALAPDVEITLYVDCSWNGAPRNHVLVALEIIYERRLITQGSYPDWIAEYEDLNMTYAYRTAETNKDGIANITFRVPMECAGLPFGKWLVLASCKIQEIKTLDWIRFDVGYPIEIELVEPDDTSYCVYEHFSVTITYKNIQMMPKSVVFVVTVLDDCDVPVDQAVLGVIAPAGVWCSPMRDTVVINCLELPQWTYVGLGKVAVSAFTDLPRLCGSAYCPEVIATFLIEWCGVP